MRLIQKQENEILAIYEKWLDSYLSGDIDAYDSYFDDAYHFIGSTNNEEFLNRKDTTEFFRETTDQFAGKTDLRNDLKTVEKFGDIVFVTHLFDAWFMNGEDWNFYGRFRFSNALHETKEGWRFIYQHFSIPDAKAKEGDTIGFDQISAENLQLKDAIHRRTKELEEKSRELQIEGAMERVRSRTMAMQKSADLPEAVNVLFNEIQKLGIPAWSAGYNILSEDRKSSICIMSSEGELQKPFVLPLTEHESFLPWYQAILNDEEFFVYGQEGEYLVSHYEYMKSLPELRSTFEQFEKAGLDLPTRQFNHLVRFNMGFLLFITYEEVPEAHKIFKRFGKVFEQTYTRFLDLQKAEVQAREAQIEAALERVRSRTMGMRHSSELQETAALLFDQIQALEINLMGCGFNIWNEDRSEATAWMSGLDRFQAPFQTSSSGDIFLRIYEAMKRGDKLFVEEQKGEELKAHYGYMASIPVFNRILKQLEEKGQSPPDFQMMHCAFFKHGYLMFITLEPATEAHEIFTRFAKVFDQTYTRFLDLKKAEKQARESEINLALERIRAATMAMHNTDEIGQTVVTFFQELRGLGLEESTRCGIGILSQAEHMQLYTASTKKGHKTKLTTGNLDMSIHPMLEGVKKAWENGEQSFSYELEGDDKYSYFEDLNKVRDYPVNIDLDNLSEIVYHFSFPFKDGVLFVFLDNPLTEEYAEICKRFANSFSATYTRFLDLKKAEEQAREAQIELSLERIRAQATAMQESSDLLDIVVTMRSEFVKLGHEAHYFWHMRWLPEEYEKAMTSGDGTRIGMVMKLPRHIHGDINPVAEWEKSKEPTYVLAMDVEEAVQYVDKMITLGDFEKVDPQAPTLDDIRHIGGLTFIMARTTHGEIGYSLPGVVPDPPKDGVDALVRFAGVFDLAYKRFEDLKKAEARAREAQIEAALERVRSRSLAMHHSSELSSVVDKLLQEFTDLEFTLTFCIINLIDEQNRSNTVWAANPETGQDAESYYMKFEDYPFHHAMWEAWKDQKKRFVYTLEGEEKKNYDEYLYSETEFRRFPEHVKEANKALERYIAGFTFFKYSGLQTVSENPISEIDLEILERFGNVFEQAYTRFLDLQKAEDQARDSQIEAALERVRSRSMGMQKSKELEEVIKVVFDQLVQLDFKIDHAGFIIDYKENDDMHIWLTDKNSIPAEVTVPYIDTPHWNSFLEAKKNDENFFANLYTYEEKNKFYRELFELIPGVAEETKDYYQKCPGLAISTVLLGDVGLYIENFEGRPFSQEENETLSRFGKVFQQTYTRFRDLERAEEQAKEAQIEAALERVRSRSMGMQKSEELADLSLEMVRQVQELGVLTWFCAFNI
ncbi:MAG TPA: nuclear transport factor 2 family protein, partial [Christiangramia sp.]|nr:nuclear transport factor 2 family protein [Christiangramia sp.]